MDEIKRNRIRKHIDYNGISLWYKDAFESPQEATAFGQDLENDYSKVVLVIIKKKNLYIIYATRNKLRS